MNTATIGPLLDASGDPASSWLAQPKLSPIGHGDAWTQPLSDRRRASTNGGADLPPHRSPVSSDPVTVPYLPGPTFVRRFGNLQWAA